MHRVCTENCKDRDIVPGATSTPKRKGKNSKHETSKVSFQNIRSISGPSKDLQEPETTNERSKLIPKALHKKR